MFLTLKWMEILEILVDSRLVVFQISPKNNDDDDDYDDDAIFTVHKWSIQKSLCLKKSWALLHTAQQQSAARSVRNESGNIDKILIEIENEQNKKKMFESFESDFQFS